MTRQEDLFKRLSLLSDIEISTGLRHLQQYIEQEQAATIWAKGTNYGKHDFSILTAWVRLDGAHKEALTEYIDTRLNQEMLKGIQR